MREFVDGHSASSGKLFKEVCGPRHGGLYSLNKMFAEVVSLQLLPATPTRPILDIWRVVSGTARALRELDPGFLCSLLESGELSGSSEQMLAIQISDYFCRYNIMNHCVHSLVESRSVHEAKVGVLKMSPVTLGSHCCTKSR